MDLQQMRYVVAVADERSFTKAAERCFVVQSALSHQIKALETELGVMLFARTKRRVELTSAGEAFLENARISLNAADRAAVDAAAAIAQIRGSLTLGLIPTLSAIDIPSALKTFRDEHPAVRVKLRGGGSDEFIAAIDAGTMDVAVLGLSVRTPPRSVASRLITTERLLAVVPATHRLAAQKRLQLAELADEPFVDFPAETPGRAQSDRAFRENGLRREVFFESMDLELSLRLVEKDLAVALLPETVIPKRAGLRAIPVSDGPVRSVYLAWSSFNPTPAARAFLQSLDQPAAAS